MKTNNNNHVESDVDIIATNIEEYSMHHVKKQKQ